ncbi:GHKL domain-containing protein [Tissierella pigra]|uniref:ATP-binding protein n=1 Tax=Tissierella pigra TaxID=2607614 RepID=UPI001C1089A8|nr:sensor histidine kinase [Tissierella pigra]MBU5425872.1 GHKL domain-containing protein [Tissierella pigra]
MNNSRILIDTVGLFLETAITYYYMRALLKDCKVNKEIELLSYFIMMSLTIITTIYYKNTIVFPIIYFILLMFISMLYKGKLLLKIILNLILIIFLVSAEVIVIAILVALTGENPQFILNNIIYYLQGLLVSKLLVLIIVKIYEYRRNNNYSLIYQKILFSIILMPISSILVLFIITEKIFATTNTYIALLIVLTISLLIIANIFVFYLFEKQLKYESEKLKLEFFRQQIKDQKKHFEELTENQRRISIAIHDTKNQLLAILGYIENNENKIAIKNLKLLCKDIVGGQGFINTGNVAVDSLINAKIKRINELGINLETSIFLEQNTQIEGIDLCIILGNLLDNAIEACEKIQLKDNKKIQIKIIQVEEYLSIKISNSIFNKVKIHKGKIPTTKKDKLFHGFGLESVKEMVEKYNGHINYEQKENNFIVNILLQNSATSPMLQK